MIFESILTVVTPADDYSLVDLATVKDELNVTGTDLDDRLKRWIKGATAAIQRHTDRVFVTEAVSETFRSGWRNPTHHFHRHHHPFDGPLSEALMLGRYPVVAISSITEDDTVLDPSDYEVDADPGLVFRLLDGARTHWAASTITVAYSGGYAADAIPSDLQDACLILLAHRNAAAGRDPTLRQENVPGVLEQQFWVGGVGDNGALPPEVLDRLQPFRKVRA